MTIALPDPLDELAVMLADYRIRFGVERDMQDDVEEILTVLRHDFTREHRLKPGPIDFLVGRIGIECKIAGSKAEVLRQCRGYLGCEELDGLLLVTSRAVHTSAPAELGGKPLRVLWVAGDAL